MSFRRYKNQVWVVDQNIKDTKTVPGWQKSLEKYLPNKRIERLGLPVHILGVQITCSIYSKGHLARPGLTLPSLGICLLLIFKIAATVLLEHNPSSPPTLALGSTRPTWLEHMAAVQLNRVRDLSAKTEGMISFFPGPWGSKPIDCTYKMYSPKKKKNLLTISPLQRQKSVKSKPKRVISPRDSWYRHQNIPLRMPPSLLGISLVVRQSSVDKSRWWGTWQMTGSDWSLPFFLWILETHLFSQLKSQW